MENLDKLPISTSCLYQLYKQQVKNWGLSKSSKGNVFSNTYRLDSKSA